MKRKVLAVCLMATLVCGFNAQNNAEHSKKIQQNVNFMKMTQQKSELATVVSNENGKVQLSTFDGNGWYCENRPDLKVGTEYVVKFDTLGTADIYDDLIIDIVEK